jgi:hypothetical protein
MVLKGKISVDIASEMDEAFLAHMGLGSAT